MIEKDGRLGGHTNTYIDPITGLPVDYGVLGFHGTSVAKDYFSRFNISMTKIPLEMPFPTKYIDLATGKVVPVSTLIEMFPIVSRGWFNASNYWDNC